MLPPTNLPEASTHEAFEGFLSYLCQVRGAIIVVKVGTTQLALCF